ncbi:acyl-CoA dehydrogenase family protein [Agromyces atrinae]|uniref:Acyl-CoA dehydrogenase n=1 Tax=Agromyces atrinae TaxID=592376 RepID=A0A4Q2MAK3_9MICO|nr:acyl-CoA dehydrogenase family protein [Agromyces atrinae]NYD68744.1 alkylation response protein AidB-like acyl-CoA dehydrogenase [Agromyces atrinae]RXZ86100.1 acyl-CoA dehydrogenase [Agromyces atrinae]
MTAESLLSADLLARIHSRAAGHDRENTFFDDDLAELAAAGYLRLFVPVALGGSGATLETAVALQRRLAAAAPATALAVNMHLVWTAVAARLSAHGDDSLDFVLREAADGEVFGFGISEAGNDLMLFGSTTAAVPESDGGYRFTGRKIFTSMSPAWTRLGTMGLDSTSADAPKIVYAFLDRGDPGVSALDDWDTLGMRASQSRTTVFDGARASADRVVRRFAPGPHADPLVFGIFAAFEILLSSVYTGIADRALELAVEAAHRRTSAKLGRPLAHDPDVRRRIAAAAIALDALGPQLTGLARDVDSDVDHGAFWFARLSALKVRATETAKDVVEASVRVAGGSSYFAGDELGRLYRDVLAGLFQPSSDDSAHGTMATAWLGPVPDGAPG